MNQPLPQQIGKYPVVRHLGSGATSEVYLCHDPFVTEASLAGKLQHPRICQIYDAVADESLHYIVMEHVDGARWRGSARLTGCCPSTRRSRSSSNARAREFAHKMGITHRDIKPANIFYAGETDVKITDCGAALIASAESTQISEIGSPAYMSPQQVKEQPLDLAQVFRGEGGRSDDAGRRERHLFLHPGRRPDQGNQEGEAAEQAECQ